MGWSPWGAANQPRSDGGFDLPGGESTAAALRRAEQERDQLAIRAADIEQVRGQLTRARLLLEAYERDIQELTGERDELVDRSLALKTELASAQQELDAKGPPTRVRYGPKVVHKLMHAEYDPSAGWRYVTGCGHGLTAQDGAALTTRPATCEWCTA